MRCIPGPDAYFEDADVLKIEGGPSAMRIWLRQASLRTASRPDRYHGPLRVTLTGVTDAALIACPEALQLDFVEVTLIGQQSSAAWTLLTQSTLAAVRAA